MPPAARMPTRALHEHVAGLVACIETAGYAVRAASTLRLRVGEQVCAAVVARAAYRARCPQMCAVVVARAC